MKSGELKIALTEGMFAVASKDKHPCSWCREQKGIPHFHGSDFDICEREVVYKLLDQVYKTPRKIPDNIVFLREGIFHEKTMLSGLMEYWKDDGFEIELDREFIYPSGIEDFPIIFHPDAIVTKDKEKFVLECKAFSISSFDNERISVRNIPPGYYGQIQCYLHYLQIDYGFFLVKNRNDSSIALPVQVEYDKEYCLNRLQLLRSNLELVRQQNTLPQRRYSYKARQCSWCIHNKKCWEGE